MKATIAESKPKGFKPLTLTIEIETEHDLVDLFHRLNFNRNSDYEGYDFSNNPKGKFSVWNTIDKVIDEAGIDPWASQEGE